LLSHELPNYDDLGHIDTVRALDPLHADQACHRLPEMNAASDVPALVATLRSLVPQSVAVYSPYECVAAMRDLGIFLGSIKRHGAEPEPLVPEVTPILLDLAARTDLVPRDTILHYTTWNPVGPRERRYTNDGQETYLQDSVRMVFADLQAALALGESVHGLEPREPAFATVLHEFAVRLRPMVDSMDLVIKNVKPAYFARELRPYLEAVNIGGGPYFGPAAAQVPMWLVDELLWASDRNDPGYQEFLLPLVPYALPRWRSLHEVVAGTPSAATRVISAMATDSGSDVIRSAQALVRALRTVVTFRGRHLGIASQVYEVDIQDFAAGSAGGSVDLLRQILDLTRLNARLARAPHG
jgi:hypothetical protein